MDQLSGGASESAHVSEKNVQNVCPICGPESTAPVGISNGLPIVRCTGCSLMYVAECPPPEKTEEFLQEEYCRNDPSFVKKLFVDYRKKSLARAAERIRSLMPKGGRLLDVGTASGCFLNEFRNDSNWRVEGVEPSRFSTEFARREFGLTVHQGFLADQKFPDSTFDVLCSLDAFVVHRQPREDMMEFFRVLSPGGLLAIEIPGHRFRMLTGSGLIYRLFRGPSLRLAAGNNFYYYTRETLTRLASIAGFEFVASHPEGLTARGNRISKAARETFNIASGALYRMTGGKLNFCAKELCIFRKPAERAGHSRPTLKSETPSSTRRAA